MIITDSTISQFRRNYPYFENANNWPKEQVELALAYSDEETGSSGWGSYIDNPRNLKQSGMFSWAAHWLVITYPVGASEPQDMSPVASNSVTSKSVGDESVSFAVYVPNSAEDMAKSWYTQTKWGQQFLQFKNRAIAAQGFYCV